ncbi:MAG: flagellar protein FlaG [Candidatus Anammoxibacter sp.]
MGNIQQVTQPQQRTFASSEVFNGENIEKTKRAYVNFRQEDKKPVDNVVKETVPAEESKESRKNKEVEEINNADNVISIRNNKLQIVSDDRSRTGLIVKILNRDSGEVIKQFPSDELLNIASKLRDSEIGVIVDDKA